VRLRAPGDFAGVFRNSKMPLVRSRIGARSTAVDHPNFICARQRSMKLFANQRYRFFIVSLAARRKGIARYAVLHLDSARAALGLFVIGSCWRQLLFYS
jgi:hypothetical protein